MKQRPAIKRQQIGDLNKFGRPYRALYRATVSVSAVVVVVATVIQAEAATVGVLG